MKFFGLIFNNLLYKIVAVLIAGILWAASQGFQSEEESLDLPISLENVPESVVVVDQSAAEINLRLSGSRAALSRAQNELLRYPISLEGVKPGEARFSVSVDHLTLPRGALIAARSPSTVVLQIEQIMRKTVPVKADRVGEPPAGFRVASVRVLPGEVVVEGARSSVRRVREVLTDRLDVSELVDTTELQTGIVIDRAHVWRPEDDREPVTVEVRIVPDGSRPAGEGD